MPIKFKGRVLAPELDVKSRVGISVESPAATEDITLIAASNIQRTILSIGVVLRGSGSPSVTWTLRHGPDRSAAGSEVITGGTVTTDTAAGDLIEDFDSAKILHAEHLWLEISATGGTVDEFALTLNLIDE